jgi:hypothetical protein
MPDDRVVDLDGWNDDRLPQEERRPKIARRA